MSSKRTHRAKSFIDLAVILAVVVFANLLSTQYFSKFDLTKEKRYTLSETSRNLAQNIDDYIYIKVYLTGELSSKFKTLESSTKDMLSNFREVSGNRIEYEFVDPFKDKDNKQKQELLMDFEQKGISPYDDVDDEEIESQKRNLIIPGAEVFYGTGKSFVINLLKTEYGQASEETVNQSIENLEYEIAHAIRKCKADQDKRIGFLTGHGELGELPLYDLKKELASIYRLDNVNINLRDSAAIALYADKFTDDDDEQNAKIILTGLQNRINQYDAIVVAKPRTDLTREESFLVDQYMMQGGNTIWFIDALQAEMDSMGNGRMVAVDYPLDNIKELLFHYGVRVNVDLLQDFRCNDIALRDPYSANSYRNFPWVYFPVFTAHPTLSKHPINRNIEGVWSRFGGTLKILSKENIKATPLLISSDKTKISNSPALVEFSIIDKIRANDQGFTATYNNGNQVCGVLLEGNFKTAFARRNVRSDLPFKESGYGSIIVIADGDIARNHVSSQGGYLELGKDHITGRFFGNKKFLLNCFDYILDDSGLIEIRSKEIILRLLDKGKIKEERGFWQFFNLGLPVILIILFGLVNSFVRKRKYAVK